MKKCLKILLFTLVAATSALAQGNKDTQKVRQPSDPNVVKEQVTRLNEEYSFMIQRGDPTEIARVLADDYILTDENGNVFTKADDLASYKNRQIKSTRLEP